MGSCRDKHSQHSYKRWKIALLGSFTLTGFTTSGSAQAPKGQCDKQRRQGTDTQTYAGLHPRAHPHHIPAIPPLSQGLELCHHHHVLPASSSTLMLRCLHALQLTPSLHHRCSRWEWPTASRVTAQPAALDVMYLLLLCHARKWG